MNIVNASVNHEHCKCFGNDLVQLSFIRFFKLVLFQLSTYHEYCKDFGNDLVQLSFILFLN